MARAKKLALVATALAVHVERWEWRQLIASEYGPPSATTRHVLHVLALYMNSTGGNCWPSQSAIAKRAALTTRAVKKHLALAKRACWLTVTEHHYTGQGWRRNCYVATVPAALHPVVLSLKKAGSAALERGEPSSPRWGTSFPKVGNHVPTNLFSESVSESAQRGVAVDIAARKSRTKAPDRSKDDLKKSTEKRDALRARVGNVGRVVSIRRRELTDSELAVKVRKLREVGQRDGDIRRALASQASAAQLSRVLKID